MSSFDTTQLSLFWATMEERQKIWGRRREGFPGPWTDDPIFREYRFCNVFREQDRTTAWIREHWREPLRANPDVLFTMAAARFINYIPAMQDVSDALLANGRKPSLPSMPSARAAPVWGSDIPIIRRALRSRQSREQKVFTSAYMISGMLAGRGGNKVDMVCDKVLLPLWKGYVGRGWYQIERPTTLKGFWELLNRFPGFGGTGFLAYEVVSDLRHTDLLCNAPDIMTWANAGPGAKRGLHRLLGHEASSEMKDADALRLMQELLSHSQHRSGTGSVLPPWFPMLEMRDIEHWLCEFDKYRRTFTGEGRPRQRFHPDQE